MEENGFGTDIALKLAAWDPYDQNVSSDFFDKEWMFDKTDGFDIVIGNPPYVQYPKGIFSEELFPFSEGKDKGKQNLYKVFVENSYNLLKSNGIATMIVQSSLMCDISSQFTRELLLKHTTLNHIIEFPKKAKSKEGQVFDNVLQGTCIYNFTKKNPNVKTTFNVSIDNDVTTLNTIEFEKLNQFELLEIYPKGFFIPLVERGQYQLIEKVSKSSIFLNELIERISQGDLNLTSDREYFNDNKTDVLLLRGKHTHKYFVDYNSDEYILANYKEDIIDKNSSYNYFVCQQITGTTDKYRIHISLTEKRKFLFGNSVNKFSLKDASLNSIILGILNSNLIDWYFRRTSTNNHVNGYELEQLPIKTQTKKQSFISIVEKIITGKKANENTSSLEHQIDIMVYHLYELTYEEACIIDPELSLEDFEKYKIEEC